MLLLQSIQTTPDLDVLVAGLHPLKFDPATLTETVTHSFLTVAGILERTLELLRCIFLIKFFPKNDTLRS
jgi:hypothetical protein